MEITQIEIQSTDIRITGPSIIPTINPPVVRSTEAPVVRGLEVPIIDVPNTSINYPVINVPTQAEFDAAVKAVETVDICLGRVYDAVMANKGHMLITADHGNVEQMQDYESGQVHTQHTTELVPFIYVGPTQATIAEGGVLADVAPTLPLSTLTAV